MFKDPDRARGGSRARRYAYRLNGHPGTSFSLRYGHATARIKFQERRGQHGAFWLQGFGVEPTGDAKITGAEIDVIEYFGDDHPDGGLTSFV